MNKSIHIKHITIENIMGIEHLEITPTGALTIIEGDNGTGKTSAMRALRSVFNGKLATLTHHGAETGRTVIVLDNNLAIGRTIEKGESTPFANFADTGKQAMPKREIPVFLNNMLDPVMIDPVRILNADPKERVRLIIEALAILPTEEQLKELADLGVFGDPNEGETALDFIDRKYKALFKEREDVNRDKTQRQSTVKQLRDGLPKDAEGTDWQVHAETLQTELTAASASLTGRLQTEREAWHSQQLTGDNEMEDSLRRIESQYAERLAEINAWKESEVGKVNSKHLVDTQQRQELLNKSLDTIRAELQPKIDQLRSDVAQARAHADEQIRNKTTLEFIATTEKEAMAFEERSIELSKQLDSMKAMRLRLIEELPIPGLRIKDATIYHNEIPWEDINTATQTKLTCEICYLRVAKRGAKFLWYDNFESLNYENLEAIAEFAEEKDLQIFCAAFRQGLPLSVRSLPSKSKSNQLEAVA